MSLVSISHSSEDNAVADELRARLVEQGFSSEGSIFLDFDGGDGIRAGQNWEQTLYRAGRACRAMIVLCSPASMASRWCFMEITHARALGKHLFPVRVDDGKVDGILTHHQLVDFYEGRGRGIPAAVSWHCGSGPGSAQCFSVDGRRPPYPGLMAFQESDAESSLGGTSRSPGAGSEPLETSRRTPAL